MHSHFIFLFFLSNDFSFKKTTQRKKIIRTKTSKETKENEKKECDKSTYSVYSTTMSMPANNHHRYSVNQSRPGPGQTRTRRNLEVVEVGVAVRALRKSIHPAQYSTTRRKIPWCWCVQAGRTETRNMVSG